jgi:hypothetical protein
LSGVQIATAAFPLPLTEGDITIGFTIEGRPTRPEDEPSARVSVVEPGFFETLRLSLKRGRFFRSPELDANNAPVVIVNEALAHKYFPGKDAVGQHIAPHVGPTDSSDRRSGADPLWLPDHSGAVASGQYPYRSRHLRERAAK